MTKWIREKPTEYSWRHRIDPIEKVKLDEAEFEWLKNQKT